VTARGRPDQPTASPDGLCGIVLAAGAGLRLRPLTAEVPKALCPVGNLALLDRALGHLAAIGLTGGDRVAVNAWYRADQILSHVDGRAQVSVEAPVALGTSGGVARLRDWVAGRTAVVVNADAYLDPRPGPALAGLIEPGQDADEVRLLGVPTGPDDPYRFGRYRFAGACLLPWSVLANLAAEPAELVLTAWRPAERAGRLSVVEFAGRYLDTGTPTDYLAANLLASEAEPWGNLIAPDARVSGRLDRAVIGAGAVVSGDVTRGVVWPGGLVTADERLVDAIRVGSDLTVPATGPAAGTAPWRGGGGRYGQYWQKPTRCHWSGP
jgi:MurNAc alpha-1-phosphate uridylyltransferase